VSDFKTEAEHALHCDCSLGRTGVEGYGDLFHRPVQPLATEYEDEWWTWKDEIERHGALVLRFLRNYQIESPLNPS